MGLLNAPMSNPDPRMKCGPRRTLGKGVLLLRTPSGPSWCRLTAFSRQQMENGRGNLAKRTAQCNIAVQDFHRHSIKKQLCELPLCLITLLWPLSRNPNEARVSHCCQFPYGFPGFVFYCSRSHSKIRVTYAIWPMTGLFHISFDSTSCYFKKIYGFLCSVCKSTTPHLRMPVTLCIKTVITDTCTRHLAVFGRIWLQLKSRMKKGNNSGQSQKQVSEVIDHTRLIMRALYCLKTSCNNRFNTSSWINYSSSEGRANDGALNKYVLSFETLRRVSCVGTFNCMNTSVHNSEFYLGSNRANFKNLWTTEIKKVWSHWNINKNVKTLTYWMMWQVLKDSLRSTPSGLMFKLVHSSKYEATSGLQVSKASPVAFPGAMGKLGCSWTPQKLPWQ